MQNISNMDVRQIKPTMKILYGESMMKTRYEILFSLVTFALLGSIGIAAAAPADTISPYNGLIGPGNSIYGLKIAFENLDESFTFNQSEKLEKQVNHADLRLAELKRELADNRSDTAEIALEQYWQKMNQTEEIMVPFSRNDTGFMPAENKTGLSQACDMITKHQQVLEELLQSHPGNPGLARAYNNSIELERKFIMKAETRHQYQQNANNSTFFPEDTSSPWKNQTLQSSDRGQGSDGNKTKPKEWNQSYEGRNRFTRNSTKNIDRNEYGANQSALDLRRQGGNAAPDKGQTGKSGQDNNAENTGNNQNNNNRNAGSTYGGNSNGNTNGNMRSPGR